MRKQRLTLRFEVGPNGKKMVTISVDFQGIPPAELALIADRLQGNDVHRIWAGNTGTHQMRELISANGDTYAELMEAIRDNQQEAENERARQRHYALAAALLCGPGNGSIPVSEKLRVELKPEAKGK